MTGFSPSVQKFLAIPLEDSLLSNGERTCILLDSNGPACPACGYLLRLWGGDVEAAKAYLSGLQQKAEGVCARL